MSRRIAVFRGINVGGRNLLPMNEFVSLLQDMGYAGVQTYIQSGNVVFDSEKEPEPEEGARIASRVLAKKGFEPRVVLLTATELQRAAEGNPFPTNPGRALHLFFLESTPRRPDTERLHSLRASTERFELQARVFYLYAPDGIGRSRLAANIESALGVAATARNWTTVAKLLSMVEQG